jgi:hypothetical protein
LTPRSESEESKGPETTGEVSRDEALPTGSGEMSGCGNDMVSLRDIKRGDSNCK